MTLQGKAVVRGEAQGGLRKLRRAAEVQLPTGSSNSVHGRAQSALHTSCPARKERLDYCPGLGRNVSKLCVR
eukprot:CAMPEP_0119107082 /NCGR_PEP_ID=MMETSP1180-20130426/7939_1 /TAXON_ID=3052 ORGANISM="Chlamydomonas cf sp, Strain CCMP681" /NCGR_SAMPLE_ID=MMETSP1180 /ASSEMBLY_ACC=CAM_ASM_000741 /LENGTH=71 /DNA_ID=CAMNT_0007092515 /DNA_START=967 /DNA_END=1179 /DNA_ORIENTATION=-